MKKSFLIIFCLIYFAGLLYLIMPAPSLPVLKGDLRSTEPGDTVQNPDQAAYFTDKNRSQVINEIKDQFDQKLGIWRFLSYRLNYAPEEAQTLVRDQLKSYYLEEVVHPLRESVFINGWEPQNSPIYRDIPQKDRPVVFIDGKLYRAKITLKPLSSPLWARLLIWTGVFPCLYLVFNSLKRSLHA